MTDLQARGWARLPADPGTRAWAEAALPAARAALADEGLRARWLDCEGTWFVGVDALPNDAEGRVAAGPPLPEAVRAALSALYGPVPPLHRAQLSAVFPGYPRPRAEESEAAFRYRLRRDAAHVDGLLPEGPARRRHLREPHLWILGLPLTRADPGASPLAVWEGSHAVMRRAFAAALEGVAPADWGEVDLTETYHAARREVFETCRRVTLPAAPGEALLLHRMTLHGIAPWAAGARAGREGRVTAYFRPLVADPAAWLSAL
ncbi:hypothetical protein DRV85_16690 [Rhodosalinus halophilus]|uniref:Phytanoyl-CoA dioxygenase (PhyH) n=1 Tax=Rhodosalinus halophilus TaxID=2259333 RepID=A0A365U531_9RHOB|nr:hypothetical protein [Rhodosalinus halophilus]RBI83267.1 hypothetical protein DRV85_16690 [Rhodosalinus halophilus]